MSEKEHHRVLLSAMRGLCPTGKKCYASRKTARKFLKQHVAGHERNFVIYRCKQCGYLHLGHDRYAKP